MNITDLFMFSHLKLVICNEKIIPMQSIVRAFGSEHPWIQDPSNTSQWLFLHLAGQTWLQPGENLLWSQPKNVNFYYYENDCFEHFKNKVPISTHKFIPSNVRWLNKTILFILKFLNLIQNKTILKNCLKTTMVLLNCKTNSKYNEIYLICTKQ